MKIKKCPHCDGRSRVYEDYTGHYAVQCDKCGIRTLSSYTSKQEAVERWNKRVNEWINPKDRLPEPFLVVLAWIEDDDGKQFICLVSYDDENKMFNGENDFYPEMILAWQPIEPFNGWSDNE